MTIFASIPSLSHSINGEIDITRVLRSPQCDPCAACFCVASFDRCPGDPVCGFLLSWVSSMGGKRVIEGFAVDVLCVRGQVIPDRCGKITILSVWHRPLLRICRLSRVLFPWLS
jgi:hypothetical protein